MDCSPLSSSVHGISQARILECVAISSSRGSFPCRNRTQVSCIASYGGIPEGILGWSQFNILTHCPCVRFEARRIDILLGMMFVVVRKHFSPLFFPLAVSQAL